MDAVEELIRFVDLYGGRAPEVLFQAALELVAAAVVEERRDTFFRFREIPRTRLRSLRRELAGALRLAHLAVALQEQENEKNRSLTDDLAAAAAAAGKRRRREGTLEAERVRLENAAARRNGR